jgi:hypothetical protein
MTPLLSSLWSVLSVLLRRSCSLLLLLLLQLLQHVQRLLQLGFI